MHCHTHFSAPRYTQCTGTFIDYTDEYLGVWIISLAWLLTFFGCALSLYSPL